MGREMITDRFPTGALVIPNHAQRDQNKRSQQALHDKAIVLGKTGVCDASGATELELQCRAEYIGTNFLDPFYRAVVGRDENDSDDMFRIVYPSLSRQNR